MSLRTSITKDLNRIAEIGWGFLFEKYAVYTKLNVYVLLCLREPGLSFYVLHYLGTVHFHHKNIYKKSMSVPKLWILDCTLTQKGNFLNSYIMGNQNLQEIQIFIESISRCRHMIGQEEFEDTKRVIGIRKSKKDRQPDETRKMYIMNLIML